MQPRWGPDGDLFYISDSDGWWNLYCWPSASAEGRQVTRLTAEIGAPSWLLGMRHWDFIGTQQASILYTEAGYWFAATVDLASGSLLDCSPRHASLASLTVVGNRTFMAGGDEHGNGGLYEYARGELRLMRPLGLPTDLSQIADVSYPCELTVPLPESATTHEGEVCYAWYYPPKTQRIIRHRGCRRFRGGIAISGESRARRRAARRDQRYEFGRVCDPRCTRVS